MEKTAKNPNTVEKTVTTAVNAEAKEENYEIIVDPIPFNGQGNILFIRTDELANKINGMFAPVMRDYSGCRIIPNVVDKVPNVIRDTLAPGEFYVDLFFKEGAGNADGVENIIRRANTAGGNKVERFVHFSGGNSSRAYILSDHTKEMLFEFLPSTIHGNKGNPRWEERVIESSIQSGIYNNSEEIVVRVAGLPLIEIINKMFGKEIKDENGHIHKYDYQISYVRKANQSDEHIINIMQMDRKIIDDMTRALNLVMRPDVGYHVYNHA